MIRDIVVGFCEDGVGREGRRGAQNRVARRGARDGVLWAIEGEGCREGDRVMRAGVGAGAVMSAIAGAGGGRLAEDEKLDKGEDEQRERGLTEKKAGCEGEAGIAVSLVMEGLEG